MYSNTFWEFGNEGSSAEQQPQSSNVAVPSRVESILCDVKVEGSCKEVIGVGELHGLLSALELHVTGSLSLFSAVGKEHEVPFTKLVLVRDHLVSVRISRAVEVSVAVGGKRVDAFLCWRYPGA